MPDLKSKASVNILALLTSTDRHIYLYDNHPSSHQALMQALGRHAADPELSLGWRNAAVLLQRARQFEKSNRT